MSIEQVRDAVALAIGYTIAPDPTQYTSRDGEVVWLHPHGGPVIDVDWVIFDHPCPTELGAVLSLLPEGWEWFRKRRGDGQIIFVAESGTKGYGQQQVSVAATGNHVADATRLLHAVLTAQKGNA